MNNVIKVSTSCQIGCVRSNNEDMILVNGKFIRNDSYSTSLPYDDKKNCRMVFAVADGMGGHQAGEVASEQVLIDFNYFIKDMPSGLTICEFDEAIIRWLDSINRKIHLMGINTPEQSDMGTTLVALIFYENRKYWLNCGDSRLYLYRNGALSQITVDHSLNTLVGEKKHSNIITNCIGAGCTTSYIDIYDFTQDVMPGDVLLLCSDGLNDMISDEAISSVIQNGGDATMLCNAAIEAGGRDNVSVLLLNL